MSLAIQRLFSVQGKTVVITGGGRGIGAMISKAFVENGANVFITSRKASALTDTAEKLNAAGPGTCTPLAQDLTAPDGAEMFAEAISERCDSIDVLVNNSGTSWGNTFEAYESAAWEKVFGLNVRVPFELTRALAPKLLHSASDEDPSRVINIGSIAGLVHQPVPTYAYDASKAAIHMLTKKLASEFAGKRITVNAIAPGYVPSAMSMQLTTYTDVENIIRAVPLGRLGTAEDVGGAALWLASRAGAWVTGAVVPVDGGALTQPITIAEES
jgi:NAD(P)-dependent dehydrogenase (short-subunit alcohol dehydrogenase family)